MVLIDTAGRLHTKVGLMDELGKVKRVIERQAPVGEVLLVLDATTGQNGLTQARIFAEVVTTGIVLTKLDGSAKGGIVVQVQRSSVCRSSWSVSVKVLMILLRSMPRSSWTRCWSRQHDQHPASTRRGRRVRCVHGNRRIGQPGTSEVAAGGREYARALPEPRRSAGLQ